MSFLAPSAQGSSIISNMNQRSTYYSEAKKSTLLTTISVTNSIWVPQKFVPLHYIG